MMRNEYIKNIIQAFGIGNEEYFKRFNDLDLIELNNQALDVFKKESDKKEKIKERYREYRKNNLEKIRERSTKDWIKQKELNMKKKEQKRKDIEANKLQKELKEILRQEQLFKARVKIMQDKVESHFFRKNKIKLMNELSEMDKIKQKRTLKEYKDYSGIDISNIYIYPIQGRIRPYIKNTGQHKFDKYFHCFN